ncbi:MAG: glycerophosphodiester phosphodiesterase family protein [Bacillota bacterium]
MISGHRGTAAYAPENTLAAFRSGWERGADLVEMDVQVTRDGHVVVFHDATLDRTTNGTGFVGEKTLSDLRVLDAGSWFGVGFAGERIPTFEEVVTWAKGRIGLNVELKSGPYPFFYPELPTKVVEILRAYDMVSQTLVISFDHTLIREIKSLEPNLACAINFNARLVDPLAVANVSRADVLNMSRSFVSPDLIGLAHAHSLGVQCFCDDPREAAYFARMGVDFIDTDHPDEIRAAVRGIAPEKLRWSTLV